VNIFPHEYTPINSILGNTTFSSQILSFEGVFVVVGDYYYNERMKRIEKRLYKRKRGESSKSRSFIGIVVEWKVGPDLEENDIQTTSTIHAFAGLNSSSFLEVTISLRVARTRINELKTELKMKKR
jgi:hypothetical protein